MTNFLADYDDYTNNTTVTTGISDDNGDSVMGAVTPGTGGTIVYSTAQESHGNSSVLLTPNSTNACYIQYNDANHTSGAIAFYVYMTGSPSATLDFPARVVNSSNSTLISLQMTTGRILRISAGTSVQGTVAMALNTWYRVELTYANATTSPNITAKMFVGDSTTAADSINLTPAALGTSPCNLRVGKLSGTLGAFYVDSFKWVTGSATELGPWVVPPIQVTITDNVGVSDSGEVSSSEFVGEDLVGITDTITVINASQQDIDTSPHPVQVVNQGTPLDTSYFIIYDVVSAPIKKGTQFRMWTGAGSLKEATVFTVTTVGAEAFGFRNISVSPQFATIPATGDVAKTDAYQLTTDAVATKTAAGAATQALTATQSASASVIRNALTDQTITATQPASASAIRNAATTQSVTATQSAAGLDTANAAATQSVTATQAAAAVDIANADAAQAVTATQSGAATKTAAAAATQTLTATQAASASVTRAAAATQSVTATATSAATKTAAAAASQTLTATQFAAVSQTTSAEQNVVATGTAAASVTRAAGATQALTATGTASASVTRAANVGVQALTATGAADAQQIDGANASQALVATQSAAAAKTQFTGAVQNLVATQEASATITRAVAATQTLTATGAAATGGTQTVGATQALTATQSASASVTRVAGATLSATATSAAGASVGRVAGATQALAATGLAAATKESVAQAVQSVLAEGYASIDGSQFILATQDVVATQMATAFGTKSGNVVTHALTATQQASASIVRRAETSQALDAQQFAQAVVIHNVDADPQTLTLTPSASAEAYSESEGDAVQLVVLTQQASATIVRGVHAHQSVVLTQQANAIRNQPVTAHQSVVLTSDAEAYTGAIDEDVFQHGHIKAIDRMPVVKVSTYTEGAQ